MAGEKLTNRETEERLLAEVAATSLLEPGEALRGWEATGLRPEHFAFHETRAVLELMLARLEAGEPCGVLQLEGEARRKGFTWAWLVGRQGEAAGSMLFAGAWAKELRELASRRQLRALAIDLEERSRNLATPTEETIAHLSECMNGLVSGGAKPIRTLDDKLEKVAEEIAAVGAGEQVVLKTGIELWDTNVGGLWPTLTVIGGHPSRGKSGLVATMLWKLAEMGRRPAVFSLEDAAEWLTYRYLAHVSRVPLFVIRTREMTEEQTEAVGQAWGEVRRVTQNIIYDDRSRLSPREVVAGAREMILRHDADAIFLDHLGELSYEQTRGGDRFDLDVAEGLMDLRALAKTHGVPVVVLSHLTRGARPPHGMSDFANAAAIERCARVAAIAWTNDGAPTEPFISIVKNTHGKRDFELKFQLDPVSALVDEPQTVPLVGQGALL